MARTNIPVQVVSRAGVNFGASGTETSGDTVNGHQFTNDGATYLFVRQTDVVNPVSTVTVLVGRTVDGLVVASRVLTIPANGQQMLGPFPPEIYNQDNGPLLYLDAGDADLRLSVWKLGV